MYRIRSNKRPGSLTKSLRVGAYLFWYFLLGSTQIGENYLFDPSDPVVTPDPTIFCVGVVVKVPVTLTKFGQNRM